MISALSRWKWCWSGKDKHKARWPQWRRLILASCRYVHANNESTCKVTLLPSAVTRFLTLCKRSRVQIPPRPFSPLFSKWVGEKNKPKILTKYLILPLSFQRYLVLQELQVLLQRVLGIWNHGNILKYASIYASHRSSKNMKKGLFSLLATAGGAYICKSFAQDANWCSKANFFRRSCIL